jgi:hypothetical protein
MAVVRSQCRCDRAWIAQIAHGRLEVDDGFGWQIGDCGGADVLDAGDEQGCEQYFEVVAFLLALHGLSGVGVGEIDGCGGPGRPVLLAAHRDTAPGLLAGAVRFRRVVKPRVSRSQPRLPGRNYFR